MAEDRMAVLDTARKAIAKGDPDFLREGVRVLAQAVMEAEVSLAPGASAPGARLTGRHGYREALHKVFVHVNTLFRVK